jgi:hypothetical protein
VQPIKPSCGVETQTLPPSSESAASGRNEIGRELRLDSNPRAPVLAPSLVFLRQRFWKLLAISAAVLAPCFWHRNIEAGDLGSHVYNAWLAQLIQRSEVPGLWIARQWNNVLFDFLLSGFGSIFGLRAAERIAVSLAVLIFFWGTFTLVCAATRRAPWFLLPLIAMISYGWTFELGFFNYYISLGLSFFGIAIVWRGTARERLASLALVPLAFLAHPLGAIWLAAAAVYLGVWEIIPHRFRLGVLLAAIAILVGLHFYLAHHYIMDPPDEPLYTFTGADQLLLFGRRYAIPAATTGLFVLIVLATDAVRRRRDAAFWRYYRMPVELLVVLAVAVVALPDGIHLPQYPSAVALLTERLTSVTAVLFCCLLGAASPQRWHLIGFAAIAAVFFSFLCRDTAVINRMESSVERLVRTVPRDQRILATIGTFPGSRVLIQHIVDRACIGHCFSYGNYEAATQQFRIRARPGNPYVMTNDRDTAAMEDGFYAVRPEDLPAWQIYQCSLAGTDLCIRPLSAGEDNDETGVHPDVQPDVSPEGQPTVQPATNPSGVPKRNQ